MRIILLITLCLSGYGWNWVVLKLIWSRPSIVCVRGLHQPKLFQVQLTRNNKPLTLFISCRWQSFQRFPVWWNQRGEKDPEKQKPPKDVRRLGTADERHGGETDEECRRGEVSLSKVLLLANSFLQPVRLVSNCVCWLLFHRISVTFNVNNSIPPNFEEEAEQGQQKSGEEEVCLTQGHL